MNKQNIDKYINEHLDDFSIMKTSDFMLQCFNDLQPHWVSDHTVVSGSLWEHKNGNKYEVITIANSETKTDRYPVTVVYKNISNGTIWSRELIDWHRSMALLPPTQKA